MVVKQWLSTGQAPEDNNNDHSLTTAELRLDKKQSDKLVDS